VVITWSLQSVDFVQVFQSYLSYDSVFAFKCSYPFVHMMYACVDLLMVFTM